MALDLIVIFHHPPNGVGQALLVLGGDSEHRAHAIDADGLRVFGEHGDAGAQPADDVLGDIQTRPVRIIAQPLEDIIEGTGSIVAPDRVKKGTKGTKGRAQVQVGGIEPRQVGRHPGLRLEVVARERFEHRHGLLVRPGSVKRRVMEKIVIPLAERHEAAHALKSVEPFRLQDFDQVQTATGNDPAGNADRLGQT